MSNDGKVVSLLEHRRAEREALLHCIEALLRKDTRVIAAWLTGSLGRGDQDNLSDIDVWIVFDDVYQDVVFAERHAYVARVAPPLLIREAPNNAPSGGSCLLVQYNGATGPHHSDWSWQPYSTAALPPDARVLFMRAEIPIAAERISHDDRQRQQAAADRMAFFWAMSSLAAKKIARRQPWAALAMLSMLRSTINEALNLLGVGAVPHTFEDRRTNAPPLRASDQLAALRAMAEEVERLMPKANGHATAMTREHVMATKRFFDLVEMIIAAGTP